MVLGGSDEDLSPQVECGFADAGAAHYVLAVGYPP